MTDTEHNQMKVTIDIYSGRENPEFILNDEERSTLLDLVQTMKIKETPTNNPLIESPDWLLGYRGIIIEQTGNKPSLFEHLHVRRGYVTLTLLGSTEYFLKGFDAIEPYIKMITNERGYNCINDLIL